MAELKRTQVYLTGEELSALDRRQRGTGTDRSQLIRRAIDREYLGRARLSKADRLSVVRRAGEVQGLAARRVPADWLFPHEPYADFDRSHH